MFETITVGAVVSDATTVAGVWAGVIGVALAIALGPRLFRAGLKMLKGR